MVRPLLSAERRQDHGGAAHQGTWKLGCSDLHEPVSFSLSLADSVPPYLSEMT